MNILNEIEVQKHTLPEVSSKSGVLIDKIFSLIVAGIETDLTKSDLKKLQKTYEIKKKVFQTYNSTYKPETTLELEDGGYVKLLLSFVILYDTTKDLRYFNTSLKLWDTLTQKKVSLNILSSIKDYLNQKLELIHAE